MNIKKIILILTIISFTNIVAGQNKDSVRVYIVGCKTNGTISIDDLLKVGELSVDNKPYSVVGFKLVYNYGGFLKELKSDSNKFTSEMNDALINLKTGNTNTIKILFEDIIIKTPQNTRSNYGILIYKVKIK